MINIYLDNVYVKVENASQEIENIIYNELSFIVEEFGTDNVRTRHLFNRKTKKSYVGLINYIIDILNREEQDYSIIDNRVKHEPNADFKIVEQIEVAPGKFVPLTARPYQNEIVERATERECIQAATGAGKTFMMASLIAKFNVKPVSVFADKLSLCTQIKEEFEKFLGRPIGIVGGGMNQKEDITVYSIQSANPEDVKDSKMIMFDECLTGDTLITLSNGTQKTIKEIVENKLECEVITYNSDKNCFEIKQVYDWQKIPLASKNKRMVKVVIEDELGKEHIIECTEDHKIWIESEQKYIEAGKLIENMEVICDG